METPTEAPLPAARQRRRRCLVTVMTVLTLLLGATAWAEDPPGRTGDAPSEARPPREPRGGEPARVRAEPPPLEGPPGAPLPPLADLGEDEAPTVKPEPMFPAAEAAYEPADLTITRTRLARFEGETKVLPLEIGTEEDRVAVLEHHPVLQGQRGLKARRDLRPHELIARYRGRTFSPEAFRRLYGHYSDADWSRLPTLQCIVDVQTLADGEPITWGHVDAYAEDGPACLAALANHSGKPNAELVTRTLVDTRHGEEPSAASQEHQVFLVALEAIPAGHEILVNYGGVYQAELEAAPGYVELTPTTHLGAGAPAPATASAVPGHAPAQSPLKRKAAAATAAGPGEAGEGAATTKRARVPAAGAAAAHDRTPRPAACAECGDAFESETQLMLHGRDGGCRPFACAVAGCTKHFATASSRTVHLRSHTGARPYVCTAGCSKSFTLNNARLRHERTHAKKNRHTCDACGKTFARKDGLSRHGHEKRCKG